MPPTDDLERSRIVAPYKIAAATDSRLLLAENPNRIQATVYNDSAATLYLHYGGSIAQDTGGVHDTWEVLLGAGGYYETIRGYIGAITVVWSALGGFARGVELLAVSDE